MHTYKQLCNLFLQRASALFSDGTVTQNGTVRVCTTSGSTLTSDNVIETLRAVEKRKKVEAQRKVAAEVDRQQCRVGREVSEGEKERARMESGEKATEKEKSALQLLKAGCRCLSPAAPGEGAPGEGSERGRCGRSFIAAPQKSGAAPAGPRHRRLVKRKDGRPERDTLLELFSYPKF